MEGNAEQGIELNGDLTGLALSMPKVGNYVDTPPTPGNEGKEAAEAKAKADAAAAAKAAEETKAKAGAQGQEPTLTDEQIQGKLDELANKDAAQLTDEEKKFITDHTEEELDEINTVKQNFETKYGIKIEGTYENSPDGLVQLAEVVGRERAKQMMINHFQTNPAMADFYNHVVVEKRSLETFFDKNKQPEFKSVKIEQTSDSNDEQKNKVIVDNQKKAITMDLKAKGISQDDIDAFINLYEDKGNLYDKAKESYNSLEKKHKETIDAKLASEQTRIEAEQRQEQEIYNKVVGMIDTNNFEGVSIPAAELKAFKEAVTKPVDEEGRTLLDYKRSKLTLAQRVLLDYFVFKDLKNVGLGAASVGNKKFTFKKAAEANDDRGGGRLRGAGQENTGSQSKSLFPQFDMTQIKVERQTI